MKKTLTILMTAIFCTAFLSGCDEETDDVKNAKQANPASTEISDVKETNDIQNVSDNIPEAEKENSEASGNPNNNNSSVDYVSDEADNSSADATEAADSVTGGSYSNESGDITETAVKLHEKSCEIQWMYLVDCPYQLDYDDMSENGAVRVNDVDSLSEIISKYCEVFVSEAPELSEKYFEKDGKLYCYDGGRGANIYYKGTELIFVSEDENKASFTAVSHYADPETGEPMDNRAYDFEMVKIDGVWKTSVFTLPY